jgi:dethiobiotin synthetase
LFVTASGTDVGKTFVGAHIVAALRSRAIRVRALKPIATGFDPADVESSDSGLLLAAQGLPPTAANLDAITPWRFAAPLSPDIAAARERRVIPFGALVEFCGESANVDLVLIEGVGGVMAPIDDRHTVLDWIAALGAPALLVVGSYLGTLSHTLTAASVLRARGCEVFAVVVNESASEPLGSDETAAVLRRFLPDLPVLVSPRLDTRPAKRDGPDWPALLRPLLPQQRS